VTSKEWQAFQMCALLCNALTVLAENGGSEKEKEVRKRAPVQIGLNWQRFY